MEQSKSHLVFRSHCAFLLITWEIERIVAVEPTPPKKQRPCIAMAINVRSQQANETHKLQSHSELDKYRQQSKTQRTI